MYTLVEFNEDGSINDYGKLFDSEHDCLKGELLEFQKFAPVLYLCEVKLIKKRKYSSKIEDIDN